MTQWIRTADRRPTIEPAGQVDVLFGSPDWGIPFLGMYTHFPDEKDAYMRWSRYDQINDKFFDCLGENEPEPEFWMLRPALLKPWAAPEIGPAVDLGPYPHLSRGRYGELPNKTPTPDLLYQLRDLCWQWDDLMISLEECGGQSGSPGEGLWERIHEIETILHKRDVNIPNFSRRA